MMGRGAGDPQGRRVRRQAEAVYVISVAAELAGMHPQTLRLYERKGLIQPLRTAGNTRRYSEGDIAALREIQRLTQDEGVNLAGASMIIELRDALDAARRRIVALEEEAVRMRRAHEEALAAAHRSYRRELVRYEVPAPLVRRRLQR